MPNRLATESSPYLRQHADNPVDWYPWGPEALQRAVAEDKPILLSIGYAACHWCHVMAHESFADARTAALMNEHFVPIKVDREERPDLDAIYMQAVQAMTGRGGWPMTVFLTPAGEPFYGGTYFPPTDQGGMPSFARILASVAHAYRTRRAEVGQTVERMMQLYRSAGGAGRSADGCSRHTLDLAFRTFAQHYDDRHGGFDGAPKFPPTMVLDFLLRYWRRTGIRAALEMVTETFHRMARGGIHDQIGGGIHRYAVDEAWLVPHFEKMLYDNALFSRLGTHLWQATGDEEARRVTCGILDWVGREMTDANGGFYASLDADSEGEEGRYYVWSEGEIDALLGRDATLVKEYFGVTAGGNFEGHNILHVAQPRHEIAQRHGMEPGALHACVTRAIGQLAAARAARPKPARDDKMIASWNGLMLRAVATAARAFREDGLREVALRNAHFLRGQMLRDGRVMRCWTEGTARIPGFLEDHAGVALGFLAVYELTFDRTWIECAETITRHMIDRFGDGADGTFYDTPDDGETLITRPRDVADNAIPSGSSLAAELLAHLGSLRDDGTLRARARNVVEATGGAVAQYPAAFGHLLGTIDLVVEGPTQVAIVGDPADRAFAALRDACGVAYAPSLVLFGGDSTTLGGTVFDGGQPAAYVCHGSVCDPPTLDPSMLETQLMGAGRRLAP